LKPGLYLLELLFFIEQVQVVPPFSVLFLPFGGKPLHFSYLADIFIQSNLQEQLRLSALLKGASDCLPFWLGDSNQLTFRLLAQHS
jgi:hypothetical protein